MALGLLPAKVANGVNIMKRAQGANQSRKFIEQPYPEEVSAPGWCGSPLCR